MKKFISMVMAAAMVVSLVPATAFAANAMTAKVPSVFETTSAVAKVNPAIGNTELQVKIKDVDTEIGVVDTFEIELDLDNAKFTAGVGAGANAGAVYRQEDTQGAVGTVVVKENIAANDESFVLTVTEGAGKDFREGDVIKINLAGLQFTKTSTNTKATVAVSGDFGTSDDITFASILDEGIKAKVKKTVDVAPEEMVVIKDITVEPSVGNTMGAIYPAAGTTMSLKLSKGFEFVNDGNAVLDYQGIAAADWTVTGYDENKIEFALGAAGGSDATATSYVFKNLKIEATDAKSGDVATLTVKVGNNDAVKLEVAKVIDNKVVMELVDADEDVPVMWSGVDAANTGLTTGDDEHWSLDVTLKETFTGAWSNHKAFYLELPEGVYVTDIDATDVNGNWATVDTAFDNAFVKGDQVGFEFVKRVFNETAGTAKQEIRFKLELVAVPEFTGDVTLKLSGDAVDEQEVVIAKFAAPYVVKAAQNDLKIDYRNTEIPTTIEITEAEAGLWKKGTEFVFDVDKYIEFDGDATFEVNADSDMDLKDTKTNFGMLKFTVKSESGDEPAVVTIKDMALYMERNIPAGAYDLNLGGDLEQAFLAQTLAKADGTSDKVCDLEDVEEVGGVPVANFRTVKEGFINVITAGREVDDASFTTKVVVPVGETKMYSGEKEIALDVPAYINAAGYTMLPVRAVAVALGIDNNAVQWDAATKTVIIMYGQRVITMTAGQKVVYASGTAIPARSAVEIKDGRAFLGLRDLATALGVTTVNYDAATKTATLN